MRTTLNRPKVFDRLAFTQPTPDGPDGRYTRVAPCGCAGHYRRVTDGPLRGNTYGDAIYELCPEHTPDSAWDEVCNRCLNQMGGCCGDLADEATAADCPRCHGRWVPDDGPGGMKVVEEACVD